MGTSKVLGILSICTGWLIPLLGVVLSVIGLSIKEKGSEQTDKTLNVVGLIVSILAWIFYIAIWL